MNKNELAIQVSELESLLVSSYLELEDTKDNIKQGKSKQGKLAVVIDDINNNLEDKLSAIVELIKNDEKFCNNPYAKQLEKMIVPEPPATPKTKVKNN